MINKVEKIIIFLIVTYPFKVDGRNETSISDFAKLFASGGLMNGFFKSEIEKYVIKLESGRWAWKKIGEKSIAIPVPALAQFKRAETIRRIYFSDGGNHSPFNPRNE